MYKNRNDNKKGTACTPAVGRRWPEYRETGAWTLRGLRDGIPIAMGYLAVGFTIGIAAKNTGLDALQSFFMSLGMVASAGEYAALMLIGAGAGLIEMIATMVVINLRYLLMSCSLTQKLRPEEPFWKRFLLACCVTDELFGISSAVPGALNPAYTWGAMLVSVTGWCLGTVLGVEAGNILPARAASAMNVALYGMFLAIILPSAKRSRFMSGLIAAAMLSSWLFSVLPGVRQISSGFRVILLTVTLSAAAAWLRPVEGQGRPVRGEKAGGQEESA